MQNKIQHAVERKAFSAAIDAAIKGVQGDHPEESIERFLSMGDKLLAGTAPDMAASLHSAFYPGSKWEKMVIDMGRRIDPNILHTALLNGAYEAAFRGLRRRQSARNATSATCRGSSCSTQRRHAIATASDAGLPTTRRQ